MDLKNDFCDLVLEAFRREALKKLIFSRPRESEISKVTARLCAHRGRKILALEYSLPGNTVSQKNFSEEGLHAEIEGLLSEYRQANLLTALGDAEWKMGKADKEVILGADSLKRKLCGAAPSFEKAIEELDKKKNYILTGDEDFLIELGISDKNGRVHDKRQAKFRQINRFLEHIKDVYPHLPKDREILIYDLCCGKSYLSFAVYYYLTRVMHREDTRLLGIDLKRDVIAWCDSLAKKLSYSGMTFICDDVTNTPEGEVPDMVISLHACDVATDIVIKKATDLHTGVILSTPCCHKYLNDKVTAESLSFVTEFPQLRNKLCEALTDALRLQRIRARGYKVSALELTDPENTPKNTLLKAIREDGVTKKELQKRKEEYERSLSFILGENKDTYLAF